MAELNKSNKEKSRQSWLAWFGIGKQKKEQIDVLMEFVTYFNRLSNIMKKLDVQWSTVRIWSDILSNKETGENAPSLIVKGKRKGMMEIYNKKWIAFSLALDLYRILLADTPRFVSEKIGYVGRIRKLDPEFANEIDSLKLPQKETLEILGPIQTIINNPQSIIAYVKTHYYELMKKIDTLKDKKTATELRRIVTVLSNKEVEELIRCVNDIRSWPYRVAYGIKLFIERTTLFLIGGRSKYDGEAFWGFHLYFKDLDLVKTFYRTPEIRRLLTYQKELDFFSKARYAIKRSVETQGKWEGFYEFYNNLDRGENYIRMVREDFGNDEFARLLEAFKEKKHEAPVDWVHELTELSNTLVNRAYPLVIEPAAQALLKIFDAAINRLEVAKATALGDLQKLLSVETSKSNTQKMFLKILAKKRNKLKGELEKEKIEFEALVRDIVLAMPEFESKFAQIAQHANITRELLFEFAILDTSIAWGNFTLSNTPVIGGNDIALENDNTARMLAKGFAGTYSLLDAAIKEKNIKSNVEKKYQQGLLLIKELTQLSENSILPQVARCISHINSKLKDYTNELNVVLRNIEISDTQRTPQILEFRLRGQQNTG